MAVARKDNNFTDDHEVINLGARRDAMIKQIARDANFLAHHNLLDYSLLVGIHEVPETERPVDAEEYGGILSSCGRKIFYISIIDYLTAFTWKKKVENTW